MTQEPDKRYKHWLLAYHGDEDDVKIVHMTGFEKQPGEDEARALAFELQNNKKLNISAELLKDVKIAEITDSLAREIITLSSGKLTIG